MEHAQHLHRPFPWRTATVVVGAIAALELVALIGILAAHFATSLRPRAHAAPAHVVKAAAPVHKHAVRVLAQTPPHALRARGALSVLVLNGNGVSGAAGRQATGLETLGYGARSADAPRHDYARSMVLFVPGYGQEARRLGRDAGVRLIAPVDGIGRAQLRGSQLVVVLGGS